MRRGNGHEHAKSCEVEFLVQNLKNVPCRHGQISRFGVKQFSMILWFQMIQSTLLKTFHQWGLSKSTRVRNLLRIMCGVEFLVMPSAMNFKIVLLLGHIS